MKHEIPDLEKEEEPEIKLPTSFRSSKKAREFQKNIYFCFIDYTKAFVRFTTNCGKFFFFFLTFLTFIKWYRRQWNNIKHIYTWINRGGSDLILVSYFFQLSSVQSLSCVQLFATPWSAACQASLYITNSQSPPKPMSIVSVMSSNHLILCRPLLLLPSIFPSIRVFSNESGLCIRWPKYWSFSFNISPSNEQPGLISFRMGCLDLLEVQENSSRDGNTRSSDLPPEKYVCRSRSNS